MKCKKSFDIGVVIVSVIMLLLIFLLVYNFIYNDSFLTMPLYYGITIFIALIFTFVFTQKINKENKICEKTENLTNKILDLTLDNRLIEINIQEDVQFVRIRLRTISNKVNNLLQIADKVGVSDEVKYIKENVDRYENLFDNHINDLEHLKKSKKDFDNYIQLIQDKCDQLIVKLYI